MTKNCFKCKCNTCGNMYRCEVLMEKVIDSDIKNNSHCEPILECSMYTSEKDYIINPVWKCELKEKILGR